MTPKSPMNPRTIKQLYLLKVAMMLAIVAMAIHMLASRPI